MADNSDTKAEAAKLKDEGNALFVKKKYREAHAKYSGAIAKDDKNAVYFANRAACSLNLSQYLDATKDADQATKLDPLYPKAWVRLATAEHMIGSYDKSIEHYRRALQTLPVENLTSAELKQKEDWTKDMMTVKQKYERLQQTPIPHQVVMQQDNTPWARAKAMEPELSRQGVDGVQSSAWVIIAAYDQFAEGVKYMKQLKQEGARIIAHSGALVNISNGIVQDSRVFHLEDQNFLDLYNKQMMFDMQRTGAPAEGGTEHITATIIERQQKDGWDAARQALATTVRGYIMRGFLSGRLQAENHVAEEEFLKRALEILEWGHTGSWKDVPEKTKGVVFSKTFMRGVRVLHMEAYMNAYQNDPQTYPLKALYDEAKALVKECEEASRDLSTQNFGPAFTNSFYMYPCGHAITMIGFYHAQMATRTNELDPDTVENHYRQAGLAYLEAARMFLPDDEQRVWFLNVALTNLWKCGTPIRDTLPIMEQIRLAIPKMKRIWEFSSIANARDVALDRIDTIEKGIREKLANGEVSLSDRLVPNW